MNKTNNSSPRVAYMKNKITFEEHIEIGERLKEIYDYLMNLDIKISNAYGGGLNDIGFNSRIATGAVGVLRSKLDDRVCEEYKEKQDHEVVSVYYGKR